MRAPRSGLGLGSLLVAVLIVLALGVGTVYAVIPTGSGKYSACLVKATGTMRLINFPKVSTCPKGEKLISWNAKGPAGPAGPQGAQGPAGPADWNAIPNKPVGFADGVDDAGVTGLAITRVNGSGVQITPGTSGVATASCPAGTRIISGGFITETDVNVYRSYIQIDSDAWTVIAWLPATSPARPLYATAICMSIQPAGSLTVAKKGKLPARLKK
jgi:hypothetical protein